MRQQLPLKTFVALLVACLVSALVTGVASRFMGIDVGYMEAGTAFAFAASVLSLKHNSSLVMSATLGAAMLAFFLFGWQMFAFGAIIFTIGRMLATKISEATFASAMFCLVFVGLSIFNSLEIAMVVASR